MSDTIAATEYDIDLMSTGQAFTPKSIEALRAPAAMAASPTAWTLW